MQRFPNFSAGPGKLPDPVMEKIKNEMFDYQGRGFSIIEISHRSSLFFEIYQQSQYLFKKLLNLSDAYKILYVHGGASLQFAMIPLNFLKTGVAGYVDTGVWSSKALAEAKAYGEIRILASSKEKNYSYIPAFTPEMLSEDLSYVHITTNNTIYGTQYKNYPNTGKIPLIADASSDFLSKEIDLKPFHCIYGANQKNLGVSGIGFTVIREDFIQSPALNCSWNLQYKTYADQDSMNNTPNTFGIYVLKLVLEWLFEKGGLKAQEKENEEKAALLYRTIDQSQGFYKNQVVVPARSLMNVPFFLPSQELDAKFVREAEANQLSFLKGHKTVGGIRASIYNATRLNEVKMLTDFMQHFWKIYG